MFKSLILIVISLISIAGFASEAHHAPAGLDWDFFASLLNFLLLMLVFVLMFRKKGRDFFMSRTQTTRLLVEKARGQFAEAQKKYDDISIKMAQADEEAQKLIETTTLQARSEASRLLDQAQQNAQKMRKDTVLQVDVQLKRAKEELRVFAAKLAVTMAREWCEKSLTKDDVEKLNHSLLKTVGPNEGLR